MQSEDLPRNVATLILAGGEGTRLFPLTRSRCKPAVNFAGRYRLIDIPISNALNAQLRNIFVISQYLASSLNQHVTETYHFNRLQGGRIECLSPQKDPTHKLWFKGTADAVRKNLNYLKESSYDYFLILSGDQIYNMPLGKFVSYAIEKDADLTIAALPVQKEEARRMGLLKVNQQFEVTDFYEKPQDSNILHQFRMPKEALKEAHLDVPYYLGSMGIYFFKRESLEKLLAADDREDFGKHLIPHQIHTGKTCAYIYEGYWEDIGTISSYYQANLGLATGELDLNFYNESCPIHARSTSLPPARICGTKIDNSLICDGSIVHASEISRSMIGLRSQIGEGTVIKESVLIGNQYYEAPRPNSEGLPPQFTIGDHCYIERAIIDEHARIGHHVQLRNREKKETYDGPYCCIRDGIIIVPAGTDVPDYFTL